MAETTTLGRYLVDKALPPELRDSARTMTGDELEKVLTEVGHNHPGLYKDISHQFNQLGREASFIEGLTLRLSDTRSPIDRKAIFDFVDRQEAMIEKAGLPPDEKEQALDDLYGKAQQLVSDQTYEAGLAAGNPFALQVRSKARGSPAQLAGLLSTPGMFRDAAGRRVPVFVRHSYAEGLKPWEYYAATFGARQGVTCLDEDTEVLMADWSVRKIKEIHAGDWVMGSDISGQAYPVRVRQLHDNGQQPVYEYSFRNNATQSYVYVRCTDQHKLLARVWHRGSRKIKEHLRSPGLHRLSEATFCKRKDHNRFLASLVSGSDERKGLHHEPMALLLGLMAGDGCVTKSAKGVPHFSCADKQLLIDIAPELAKIGVTIGHYAAYDHGVYFKDESDRDYFFKITGRRYAHEKELPDDIYNWEDDSVAAFVAGLIATDGCFTESGRSRRVNIQFTAEKLVRGLQRLLELRFGIWSGPVDTIPKETKEWATHDQYGFHIVQPESLRRLKRLIFKQLYGIKKAQFASWDLNDVRRNRTLGCRIQDRRPLGNHQTYDLEVESADHMFVLANGLISSNSTKLAVPDAGDLGKQLNVMSNHLIVTEDDCGTTSGVPFDLDDRDNVGAVLARNTGGYDAGTAVDEKVIDALKKKGFGRVLLRSPMTCAAKDGLCKLCTGLRENGKYPELRDNIGVVAGSALAERLAQGSLNQRHSGKGAAKGRQDYSGFPVIDQLVQVPETFRYRAAVATTGGQVEKVEEAPQGGFNVFINGEPHYVSPDQTVEVKRGDKVEAGDQIGSGILNPAEVVQYKGIGEGRKYLAERLTKAFRDSKLTVNRRNAEVVARALVDRVDVNEPEGLGDYLPGDSVSYSSLAYSYVPRAGAGAVHPSKAVGKYLEQPALHYSIGTKLTHKMADELGDFGVNSVTVHDNEPGFAAVMERLRGAPQVIGKDWVAKLQGSNLKANLMKDIQSGAESDIHGASPVPGMAYGVEFGQSRPGKITY